MRVLLWASNFFASFGQPDSDSIFVELPSDKDIESMTDTQIVRLIQSFKFHGTDERRLKAAISKLKSAPHLTIEETLPLI